MTKDISFFFFFFARITLNVIKQHVNALVRDDLRHIALSAKRRKKFVLCALNACSMYIKVGKIYLKLLSNDKTKKKKTKKSNRFPSSYFQCLCISVLLREHVVFIDGEATKMVLRHVRDRTRARTRSKTKM